MDTMAILQAAIRGGKEIVEMVDRTASGKERRASKYDFEVEEGRLRGAGTDVYWENAFEGGEALVGDSGAESGGVRYVS